MQFHLKPLLLCGCLLAAVFMLASCGAKTEFEKVDPETTAAVSAIQPAAVDAVPVLTEPHSADKPSETTTRRRTRRRDNTADAPAKAPDDGAPSADTALPETPETPAESESPEAPAEPQTPTAPTEPPSAPDASSAEPTAPDTETDE